jgi:hypothetical protein
MISPRTRTRADGRPAPSGAAVSAAAVAAAAAAAAARSTTNAPSARPCQSWSCCPSSTVRHRRRPCPSRMGAPRSRSRRRRRPSSPSPMPAHSSSLPGRDLSTCPISQLRMPVLTKAVNLSQRKTPLAAPLMCSKTTVRPLYPLSLTAMPTQLPVHVRSDDNRRGRVP